MTFLAPDQVPLFLLLMLPGFISRKVYDLQIPGNHDDAGRYALDALCYGTLNAALWIAPLTWMAPFQQSRPFVFWILVLTALVVSPVCLAIATVRILRSKRLRRWMRHPTPTAWDYYFGQGTPSWVLCRLKNGKSLAGYFGPRSFAGSFPNNRDIYIEQLWLVDSGGHFVSPVPHSGGALVSFDECELVEFFQAFRPTLEAALDE